MEANVYFFYVVFIVFTPDTLVDWIRDQNCNIFTLHFVKWTKPFEKEITQKPLKKTTFVIKSFKKRSGTVVVLAFVLPVFTQNAMCWSLYLLWIVSEFDWMFEPSQMNRTF